MAYGVVHFSEPHGVADRYGFASVYRQAPVWQYGVAFLAVVILHGVALTALWTPMETVIDTPVPLRMVARTLVMTPTVERAPTVFTPTDPDVRPKPFVQAPPKPTSNPTMQPAIARPQKPAAVAKPPQPATSKVTPASRPLTPALPPTPREAPAHDGVPNQAPVRDARVSTAPINSTAPIKDAVIKEAPIKAAPIKEVPAQFGVAYLQNPAPAYPMLSRRRREQGTVQLQVWVTATGTAAKVEVLQSSGFVRLDEAALATVKGWRFVPARRGEMPVASTVKVPIVFALN